MSDIRQETAKWLGKIEPLAERIEVHDSRGDRYLTNMKAYISDCKHFLEQEDLVRAFECVIWAWSILELCQDMGIFELSE